MAENLEPINIDINMRQNVSEESDRASQGMDNLAARSNAALSAMEKDTARQIEVIKQMTYVIDELQKQMSIHPDLFTADQVDQLDLMRNSLTSTQSQLEAYTETYSAMADAVGQGIDVTALMNERTQDLFETEESLRDIMSDILDTQSEVNDIMEDNSDATDDNTESTEENSIANKLLSSAISEICTALGIENTAIVRNIASTRTLTGVKKMWATATGILNTQLGISLGLSKALVAGGIGLLIAAIAAAVYAYSKWKESQEEVNQALEDNRRLMEKSSDTIAKQTTLFNKLHQEYNALGDNLQAKKKYIDDNQKSFDQLGVSVHSVNEADNLFIANAESFRMAIEKRALAVASMEIAAEKYKQAILKMQEAEERRNNPTWWDKAQANPFAGSSGAGGFVSNLLFGKKSAKDYAAEAAADLDESAEKLKGSVQEFIDKGSQLNKDVENSGINTDESLVNGTKAFYEKQKKRAADDMARLKDTEKDTEAWKKALSEYNEATGKLKIWDIEGQNKASVSAEKKAEKARKQAMALKKAQNKQSLQEIRAAEDLEMQINEAEIKAMDEGSKKVLAQMELNHKKQIQALQRQQEDSLKAKKDNARAIFTADINNKGKSFDDSVIKLSEEEVKRYQDLQAKQTESFEKDKFNLELQYMRDYISEYGTFQQKKFLIAQEYDKKIAASSNEWEKKTLENQKRAAISNVDFEAINKQIDWQGVFGNLTGMLDSQIKDLLSNLKEYVKTDQFRASSDTDKKTVYEAIERLRSITTGGEGTLNFKEIQRQMDELGAAVNRYQIATINLTAATQNQDKAQKEYENALKTSNQILIESTSIALDAAKTSANEAVETYKNAESDVQSLGNSFKERAGDTVDGLNLVAEGLHSFASNSLPEIFRGLQSTLTGLSKLDIGGEVGKAIGSMSKTLEKAGFIGQIISAILSILDILKDGIGTLVSNLIDTVLNAVDGILSNLLNGRMFTQIFNSLKDGIGNILNTISFGGFNSLVNSINGSNAKETAETISRLTATNEALIVSVDALKEEMAGSNGVKSIEAYNEAVNAQKRYNENLRQILDAQMGYHSSHHSNSYYWDLDPKSLKEVNKLLGTSLKNTWADFSQLTADQMNEIRTHLSDVWSEMINQGKYGDRFKDDWNNYADQAGKVVELTEQLRENIAQISFESLRDSFVNALMDMDSDAQDFAGNFEEYLTKALLNFAIGDLLDDDLKKWYESWTDSMNSQAGKLTEEQIEQYKKQWDDMVQKGLSMRDEIADSTGYTGNSDSKRSASKGVAATASQDSINEFNGGIYALRQQVGDIRNLEKESVLIQRTQQASLNRIADNTEYCRYILDVKNSLEDMQIRGIKVKV